MNKRNYQRELETILAALEPGEEKKVFLHSCCAPCSSYCMEYLCRYFNLKVFYFNPNISSSEEYKKRVAEQIRLIECYNSEQKGKPIAFLEGDYRPADFFSQVKGYEQCKEGGERCAICFEMRLRETARMAKAEGYDYFATTLTISPLKNAELINSIGEKLAEEYGIAWLPSDFKKKDGYKRSIELSAKYDLYRQNFCGCSFSREEALRNPSN